MKNLLLLITIAISVVACNTQENPDNDSNKTNSENTTYSGKKIPIRKHKIEYQKFAHYFEAAGELESVNEAFISPEVSGQIVKIAVKEGDKVKKGQLLAKLNTNLIEKNMQEVKTQLDFATTMFKKQEDLWKRNIGSERQYLQAKNNYESLKNKYETLQTQYNMSLIKAPFTGTVENILLKKGELAGPGMMLMQVISLDKLILKAKLSEAYLPSVSKGDIVEVKFPSYKDLIIPAKVYRTGNVINKQNRTFVVEIKLDNTDHRLKPNMLANVVFRDYISDSSLVVPSVLVKHDIQGKYLFIVSKKGSNMIALKKYVETGMSYDSKTEIISGLSAGDVVITDGYNNVSDGSVLNIIK
jgi:RND family efflux transporter MFP subunit